MFDAQCDFAAIAFEVGDDPDRLLLQFAEDLRRSGHRVVGAVQHHVQGLRNPNLDAVMLPGAQVVNLSHHPGDDTQGCHIDNERLATIGRTIEAAIEEGGRSRHCQPLWQAGGGRTRPGSADQTSRGCGHSGDNRRAGAPVRRLGQIFRWNERAPAMPSRRSR